MAVSDIRCPVRGADVFLVTDLEGEVATIICPHHNGRTDACRLKQEARRGGPLSQLLERTLEHTLASADIRCVFAPR